MGSARANRVRTTLQAWETVLHWRWTTCAASESFGLIVMVRRVAFKAFHFFSRIVPHCAGLMRASTATSDTISVSVFDQ